MTGPIEALRLLLLQSLEFLGFFSDFSLCCLGSLCALRLGFLCGFFLGLKLLQSRFFRFHLGRFLGSSSPSLFLLLGLDLALLLSLDLCLLGSLLGLFVGNLFLFFGLLCCLLVRLLLLLRGNLGFLLDLMR